MINKSIGVVHIRYRYRKCTHGTVVQRGGERSGVQQVEAGDGGGGGAPALGASGPPPGPARARAALAGRPPAAVCGQRTFTMHLLVHHLTKLATGSDSKPISNKVHI